MNFKDAQYDMRYAYFGGGPGVLASALIWFAAGIVALFASENSSMLTLFFGGMFIYPLGLVFVKILKRPAKHQPENPLGMLAVETTFILLLGLILAFAMVNAYVEWFFPTMLLVIGGRYFVFSTIYGMRLYWLLAIFLVLAGIGLGISHAPFYYGAFAGGILELLFSIPITLKNKKIN